jgi:peptidoglycan biosynthesis protein MviN/MurJ (putative lipid II flippase)
MNLQKALTSSSVKDFSSLFFSNLLQKFFGLIREVIIASILSSSLIYAHFLMLQSMTSIFSQFASGNSMSANLLPRFTKLFDQNENISLHETDKSLKPIMFWLFLITQIIQFIIIVFLDSEYSIFLFVISFLLSFIVCLNFYNSIYLSVIQAKGEFLKYSLATSLNEFVMILFIYPLLFLFNISGLVISRIFAKLSVIYFYIIPMKTKNNGYNLSLGKDDFNIPTLILGNFANIIIFTSRFVSGSDGGTSITYFTYSIFILNVILTAVIANISTLLLKKLSLRKDNIFMLYSVAISIVVGVSLVLFLQLYGYNLVEILFVRGNFTNTDAVRTTEFLNKLSYSFVFIFISTTLFQPFLSMKIEDSKEIRSKIAIIFISTIIISLLFAFTQNFKVEIESLIVIYTCSFISLLLAAYSYFYYLQKAS